MTLLPAATIQKALLLSSSHRAAILAAYGSHSVKLKMNFLTFSYSERLRARAITCFSGRESDILLSEHMAQKFNHLDKMKKNVGFIWGIWRTSRRQHLIKVRGKLSHKLGLNSLSCTDLKKNIWNQLNLIQLCSILRNAPNSHLQTPRIPARYKARKTRRWLVMVCNSMELLPTVNTYTSVNNHAINRPVI